MRMWFNGVVRSKSETAQIRNERKIKTHSKVKEAKKKETKPESPRDDDSSSRIERTVSTETNLIGKCLRRPMSNLILTHVVPDWEN